MNARLDEGNSVNLRTETFVHLAALVDHARELVRIHRDGWGLEDRPEPELIEAIAEDLEHIPPAVRE